MVSVPLRWTALYNKSAQLVLNRCCRSGRYGSANSESHNFWVDGVPLNMAYQPTEMMKIDIGVPAPPSDVDRCVAWIVARRLNV